VPEIAPDPQVVLVDDNDVEIGTAGKAEVHRTGALHRAFSVFLRDRDGRLLLQRRALGKYHSPGLWTNTCCSHPSPGEPLEVAARRRLREEMGVETALELACAFVYRAELANGLVEHEFDHVFVGECATDPHPDPAEVVEWKWVPPAELESDIDAHPELYTAWLPLALRELRRCGGITG
jgi:isopentenyl-diphosphate Delta-isomerase